MAVRKKEAHWFHKLFSKFLLSKGLKKTKQRAIIIDFFLKNKGHVEVDNLFQVIRKEGHKIGLATIYRTLNLISESGLVEQSSFKDGKTYFEIKKPGDHHDHLFCLDCGRVVGFENEFIEQQQIKIANQYGFSLNHHRLDLYANCLKKDNCQYQS